MVRNIQSKLSVHSIADSIALPRSHLFKSMIVIFSQEKFIGIVKFTPSMDKRRFGTDVGFPKLSVLIDIMKEAIQKAKLGIKTAHNNLGTNFFNGRRSSDMMRVCSNKENHWIPVDI
jgi:hypothetical protein